MSDPFIAEIRIFPFDFAPTGWASCDGQVLPVLQNAALFSVLGTTYGGNGTTTFALPDLRGRTAMHPGEGPGLSPRTLGERGGSDTVTLALADVPTHSHGLAADTVDAADTSVPSSAASFAQSTGGTLYQAAADTALSPDATAPAGGGQPHNNLQPYLTVRFNIALRGDLPTAQ